MVQRSTKVESLAHGAAFELGRGAWQGAALRLEVIGGDGDAALAKAGDVALAGGLEPGHWGGEVLHKNDVLEARLVPVVCEVGDGRAHAVAQGLAANGDVVVLEQVMDEVDVKVGGRVVWARHLGLEGAVVLGEGVGAFVDVDDGASSLAFPFEERGEDVRLDAAASTADEAVLGPDGELFLEFLKGLKVERAPVERGLCVVHGHPGAVAKVCRGDGLERLGVIAFAVVPEDRMRHVIALMCVQRDIDFVPRTIAHELGGALRVALGAGDRQRAGGEVDLRVDEQEGLAAGADGHIAFVRAVHGG
mmetsp:Transcript_6924/g.22297  ORF Transcript_6924/g.22297 Transcript_6924/m.22297 type:complete len:305 (-) Transcript_6924:157-1071(-)